MRSQIKAGYSIFKHQGLLQTLGAGSAYAGQALNRHLKTFSSSLNYYRRCNNVSFQMLASAVIQGWDLENYRYLGIQSRDSSQYIPSNSRIQMVNGSSRFVLHDKFAMYRIFSDYKSYFPTLIAIIHNGNYRPQGDFESQSLVDAVDNQGAVIAKPITGFEGRGVRKIVSDKNAYRVDGKVVNKDDIFDLESKLEEYIVTKFINQHQYSTKIFSRSVNSIRVLSAIDPETGEVHIVRAAHRFGTNESAPTDNWQGGGVAAPVDVDTGKIQELIDLDQNGQRTKLKMHPETGEQVAGVSVPFWQEVVQLINNAAQEYPSARLIGWDIVLTDDGPMILEASGWPGSNTLQLEEGLLTEPVVRTLFSRYDDPKPLYS